MLEKFKQPQLSESTFSKYFMLESFIDFFDCNQLFGFISSLLIFSSNNYSISSLPNYINEKITNINDFISPENLEFLFWYHSGFPVRIIVPVGLIHVDDILSEFHRHYFQSWPNKYYRLSLYKEFLINKRTQTSYFLFKIINFMI